MLLPNIRINDYDLSIQEPYTLNGYIITDIDVNIGSIGMWLSTESEISGVITIMTEGNYSCGLHVDELKYKFKREMDYFISRYGNNAPVEGRRDRPDWSNYSFFNYINDIKKQCINIRETQNCHGYNRCDSYINALKSDLRRQGRTCRDAYRYNPHTNYTINNRLDYLFDSAIFRNNGDITFRNSYINNSFGEPFGERKRKYIHEYNYKPEYIPHYMPSENKDTTALFGCEIEVDCGGESEEHAKEVLKIMCGVNPNDENNVLEDKMYCTHDGSLRAGIEFDSMPASLEYHKNKMKYKEMFEYLDKNGYKAHDTETCGLHIHVNRTYLGKSELMQQLTISKILYILEKFNEQICVIARRDNSYSRFVGKDEVNKSLNKLYNKYYDTGKKVALNLKHDDTIEFRCFKGTLKYETFILTIEFVKNIVDYAKLINIEQIELIKWKDLMDTFSDKLKEYYNIRLEKEKKKQESKKSTTNANANYSTFTATISSTGINANASYIAHEVDESEISRPRDNIRQSIAQGDYIPYMSSMLSLLEETMRNESNRSSARNKEEELNNRIKSLKKQIKNSNNYLEKKNFQKELDGLQKELKKEKRKSKQTNNL